MNGCMNRCIKKYNSTPYQLKIKKYFIFTYYFEDKTTISTLSIS